MNGDIRLVGGSNPFEGRLEVCYFNQWGTICSSTTTSQVARVACRQLGYAGSKTEGVFQCISMMNVNCLQLLLLLLSMPPLDQEMVQLLLIVHVMALRVNSWTVPSISLMAVFTVMIWLSDVQLQTQVEYFSCLLYTSPSPRDATLSRMPSSA